MAKTYFVRQNEALSNTLLLIIIYILGIFLIPIPIVFLGNLFLAESYHVDWIKIYFIITFVCGMISIVASIYSYVTLSKSGSKVAKSLGALPITEFEDNSKITIFKHVVEELSLACGLETPQIFLLEDDSINAFAAGFDDQTAIAATIGALERLQRNELAGVIAHEFSHLKNKDTKINALIISLISGFSCVNSTGKKLINMSFRNNVMLSQKNKQSGLAFIVPFILGLIMYILGFLWVWYSKILQAAISRQREYLADATSISYTKDDAMARVLIKIKNQYNKIETDNLSFRNQKVQTNEFTKTASHIFFTNPFGLSKVFDSHPPLAERIKRAREMTFTFQENTPK